MSTDLNHALPLLIEPASPRDASGIGILLSDNALPVPDHSGIHFLIARQETFLVGCVGWEIYGSCALLRSLAVQKNYQGQGIGGKLVRAAMDNLVAMAVNEFYLLTTDAHEFASRFGFTVITRCEVPAVMQASEQFSSACYTEARCMRARLE